MARTVLTEDEFKGLILRIVIKGEAQFILNWMSYIPDEKPPKRPEEVLLYKDLGYRDFIISIDTFLTDGDSVIQARVFIWRESRLFSGKETKAMFEAIRHYVSPRYNNIQLIRESGLQLEGVPIEGAEVYSCGGELKISKERSRGWTPKGCNGAKHDLVTFEFRRRYD